MKVTSETLPERQVKLQIEVDDDRHAEALEQAYKRLAPKVRIRGFRPGKAPRPLIEKELGRHRLLDEAMDILIPVVYREVVEEQELEPAANPSVDLVSHEPLVFTATVPLQPVTDLGEYTSLRVPREPVTVTDEQVESSIEELRRRYGTVEPVERAAAKGDLIRGSLKAEVGGETLFTQEEIEYRLTDESLASLPGLADAVVGLTKGAETTAEVNVTEEFDNPTLAGATVTYQIAVLEVKEEKLAELNDEFAKGVGEGFESVAALRTRAREDLQKAEDETALREYESKVVDALLEQAKTEYPAVLTGLEIDRILEDQANLDPRDQRSQEIYMARLGKSEDEVRESVREEAELRLRRSLVLMQFAEAENIEIDDAEVDGELKTMADAAGEQAETLMTLFGNENGRETLRRSLLTRKTLARLVEIGGGSEPAKAAARPARARRSRPRQVEEDTLAESTEEKSEEKE